MTTGRWKNLDESGRADLDEECSLNDALFLFALRKIQDTPREELKGVWLVNAKYWKPRLPADGFEYLRRECARLAAETVEKPAKIQQQLTFRGISKSQFVNPVEGEP